MAKKSNGEGTMYFEEKRQTWCWEIGWTDANGNFHKKRIRDKRKQVLNSKIKEFKKQLLISDGGLNNSPCFQEYAQYWLKTILKNKLKPISYMRKEVTLENQVYPHIGNIPIEEISFNDVQDMVNTLNESGLSYSTIKKAFEAINGCIKSYMVQNKKLFINPCDGVVLPQNTQREISDVTFFNKEQRNLIEKEATRKYNNGKPVYRLGHSIILLMYTGMRIGEMLALTWDDIDFEEMTININKNTVVTKSIDEDGIDRYRLTTQNSTKTKSGTRVIPMTKKAASALNEIKKINGDCEYIISSINHNQLFPRNINRMFHSILTQIGIMDGNNSYGVHTLRHTFASMLFQNNCSVKVVSELLGHSDTKITENIYIHLIQKQKIKAIQDIDRYSDNNEDN